MDNYQVAEDTFVIPGALPVPGVGQLPVNAMVIRGEQPMLLDTMATVQRDEFLEKAFSIVEPQDVKWIFISHEDRDHSGSLKQVMDMCPDAKVITNFLGLGKLSEEFTIPLERVYLLNDGDTLDIGDRTLRAVRPPLYDSSATRGIYDPKTSVYFAADCFGAVQQEPVEFVDDMPVKDYEEGFFWMNRVNHVWFHHIPPAVIEETAVHIRELNPAIMVSGHGPTARQNVLQLCDWIVKIGDMDPVPMPSQADFEKMIAGGGD